MDSDVVDEPGYAVRCPECEESIVVNGAMKAVLLDRGCVLCGAALSGTDFRRRSTTDCRSGRPRG